MQLFSLPVVFYPVKILHISGLVLIATDGWWFILGILKLKRNTNPSKISRRDLKSAFYLSVHQSP